MTTATVMYAMGVELPEDFSLLKAIKARFTRAHYRHKGRRAYPTSLPMQIFGHPSILEMLERLGL